MLFKKKWLRKKLDTVQILLLKYVYIFTVVLFLYFFSVECLFFIRETNGTKNGNSGKLLEFNVLTKTINVAIEKINVCGKKNWITEKKNWTTKQRRRHWKERKSVVEKVKISID